MKVHLREIASLFCLETQWSLSKIEENFKAVYLEFDLSDCSFDVEALADEPDLDLSQRDTLSIILMQDGERVSTYYPTEGKDWDGFIKSANENSTGDKFRLLVDVKKTIANQRLSIYYQDVLLKYVDGLAIEEVIEQFDNLIAGRDYLIFEVQYSPLIQFRSRRFAFVQKDGAIEMLNVKPNLDIVEKSKKICTNNLTAEHLLPEHFEIENDADVAQPWQRVFCNLGQVLSLCYLANYSKIGDGKFEYKINGYKTVHHINEISNIATDNLVIKSLPIYYQIYKWLYEEGNLYDKITIIRNIVTLNAEDDGISLKDTTFDSILSNYSIFEKKNVEQYIGLRNNVAVQLRVYQKEILDAVENYEKGMRTMYYGYLTFIFTTVVIRVLATNMEDKVLIPDTIIVLLMLYCVASLLYQCFTRSVLNGRIELLDKQYNETRNFYAELLSEKELNELFTDQRNKDGTYRCFLKEREVHFDILWMVLNVLTVIGLIYIMLFINH